MVEIIIGGVKVSWPILITIPAIIFIVYSFVRYSGGKLVHALYAKVGPALVLTALAWAIYF